MLLSVTSVCFRLIIKNFNRKKTRLFDILDRVVAVHHYHVGKPDTGYEHDKLLSDYLEGTRQRRVYFVFTAPVRLIESFRTAAAKKTRAFILHNCHPPRGLVRRVAHSESAHQKENATQPDPKTVHKHKSAVHGITNCTSGPTTQAWRKKLTILWIFVAINLTVRLEVESMSS